MQSLLAQIYVNKYAREVFDSNPDLLFDRYRLTEPERDSLRALNSERVSFHAKTLVSKRAKRLRHYFPLLFQIDDALEPSELPRYVARFHALHPKSPSLPPQVEVMQFAEFIASSIHAADELPAYASDIARYEGIVFEAEQAAVNLPILGSDVSIAPDDVPSLVPGVHVAAFQHDVCALIETLGDDRVPPVAPRSPTALALRYDADGLSQFAINGPTQEVLQRIDGRRTVRHIVALVEASLGGADLFTGVVGILKQFEADGMLFFNRDLSA